MKYMNLGEPVQYLYQYFSFCYSSRVFLILKNKLMFLKSVKMNSKIVGRLGLPPVCLLFRVWHESAIISVFNPFCTRQGKEGVSHRWKKISKKKYKRRKLSAILNSHSHLNPAHHIHLNLSMMLGIYILVFAHYFKTQHIPSNPVHYPMLC